MPIGLDWQKKDSSSNYCWDDPDLQAYITEHERYGVVAGIGDLIIIDADEPEIEKVVEDNLPATFTVKTGRDGGGKHYYFYCFNFKKKKILYDGTRHLGEIQSTGSQCIGPGSIYSGSTRYEVVNDTDITTISSTDIYTAFDKYLKKEDITRVEEQQSVGTNIDELNIERVANTTQLMNKSNGEYQGAHPVHGSDSGTNFSINPAKNCWHCFRCDSGGGPLSLIAVQEGIIDCSDARRGALRGEDFKAALKIAVDKYGLTPAPIKDQDPECPNEYKEDGRFSPRLLAVEMLEEFYYATLADTDEILIYRDGIYQHGAKTQIRRECLVRYPKINQYRCGEVVFQIKGRTGVKREDFDRRPELIHVENGIVNVETGEFQDFSPEIMALTNIPVKYDSEKSVDYIKGWLVGVLSPDDVPVVQEYIGYCLYKGYPMHKALMCIGRGANGKSTFLGLIKKLLGTTNVSNHSLHDINKDRFASADLYGKLANIHTELSSMKLGYTGTFKQLTGEDMISAQHKFKNPFSFHNYAKLLFACNQLPPTSDTSDAFFRRWLTLDFNQQFTDEDADNEMLNKLGTPDNLSGLLNWAIEGYIHLREKGKFTTNTSTSENRRDWEFRSDSLKAFIFERIVKHPEGFIVKDDLYQEYGIFCEENELIAKENNTVGKEIKMLIPTSISTRKVLDGEKSQTRIWSGIIFKKDLKNHENPEKPPSTLQKCLTTPTNSQASRGKMASMRKCGEGDNVVVYKSAIYPDLLDYTHTETAILEYLKGGQKTPVEMKVHFDKTPEKNYQEVIKRLKTKGDIYQLPSGEWTTK
jgi:P4 family phage/plasmid primase-like protien